MNEPQLSGDFTAWKTNTTVNNEHRRMLIVADFALTFQSRDIRRQNSVSPLQRTPEEQVERLYYQHKPQIAAQPIEFCRLGQIRLGNSAALCMNPVKRPYTADG